MKELWNERFSNKQFMYGKSPNEFIKQMAPDLPKGKVLAIAEGEGRNAVFLASLGHEVTMWDFSSEALKKARQLADEKGVIVDTENVDLNDAPWTKETWDHIICVFGHFQEELRKRTLNSIEKAVKPGGSFLCEVYSYDQLHYRTGGPKEESWLYRPEDFITVFRDWKWKHFFVGEVYRKEGSLHEGLSHVIQFYGIKK